MDDLDRMARGHPSSSAAAASAGAAAAASRKASAPASLQPHTAKGERLLRERLEREALAESEGSEPMLQEDAEVTTRYQIQAHDIMEVNLIYFFAERGRRQLCYESG